MDSGQNFKSAAEVEQRQIIEIILLRGSLAELLGSEVAAFYERAGLCCDD